MINLWSLAAALPGKGASQGEESVLADSGREGVITAGVGRVRRLDFLSILLTIQVVVSYVLPDSLSHKNYVFTQTVSITGVLTL